MAKPQLSARLDAHKSYLPTILTPDRDFLNCRVGVGVAVNPLNTYNTNLFKIGWYVDWRAQLSPIRPNGIDFYHTLRVKQDKIGSKYLPSYRITPALNFTPSGLGPMVQANVGNVWLIGNEIDRVNIQDDILPDMYAQIYHDAYYFIKGIDPTAKVAIGAIVQPTPVRLQYLDMILQAYLAKFDAPMPVDIWNIHVYILPEMRNGWGGEIPPGVDVSTGMLYTIRDHVDINVFRSLVIDMRTWMKSRGYQDKPLISTEFARCCRFGF